MSIFSNLFKNFCISSKKTNMEKEIYEQPTVISQLIKKYISKDGHINIELPSNISKIALVASGSSYHSATIAASYFRANVHCDAQSYYASEFSLIENPIIESDTLYVFISQSGETSDTNKALDIVRSKTNKTLAITNIKNSTLYNNSQYKILLNAGKENSIASTKAMSAQIFCLFLIAVKIMQSKYMPVDSLLNALNTIPQIVKQTLEAKDKVQLFAQKLVKYDNAAILASGMFYPLAKEGALKIKETCYINTTAYPTGEFLHGHIAILNKKCAVISIVSNTNVEFTLKVLEKINDDYESDTLIISAFKINVRDCKNIISIDAYNEIEFLFASLVIFQLIAFYSASFLGRSIDSPIGLSKVVKEF